MATLGWILLLPQLALLLVQVAARLALAIPAAVVPSAGLDVTWLTLLVLPLMGVMVLGEEAWLPWRREAVGGDVMLPIPAKRPGAIPIAIEMANAEAIEVEDHDLTCDAALRFCDVCPATSIEPAASPVHPVAATARGDLRSRRPAATRRWIACGCGQRVAVRRCSSMRNGSRSRRGAPMSTTTTSPV